MRRRMFGLVVVIGLAAGPLERGDARPAPASKPGAPGPADGGVGQQVGAGVVAGAVERRIDDHDLSRDAVPRVEGADDACRSTPTRRPRWSAVSRTARAYTFKVAAHNAVGTGKQSAASKAVTIGVPSAPSRLTVAPGNGQATVSWRRRATAVTRSRATS